MTCKPFTWKSQTKTCMWERVKKSPKETLLVSSTTSSNISKPRRRPGALACKKIIRGIFCDLVKIKIVLWTVHTKGYVRQKKENF